MDSSSLSSPSSRRISLTLTLLPCHSKWAYRQLQGAHTGAPYSVVFITLALTFTQMGPQSSFVFIFSPLPLSLHISAPSWWLRRFVIFRGSSRSQTHFTLMDQLPSAVQTLCLSEKIRREGHAVCRGNVRVPLHLVYRRSCFYSGGREGRFVLQVPIILLKLPK